MMRQVVVSHCKEVNGGLVITSPPFPLNHSHPEV